MCEENNNTENLGVENDESIFPKVTEDQKYTIEDHNKTAEEIAEFFTLSSKEKETVEIQNQADLASEYAYREKMRTEQARRTEEITRLFINYRGQQAERYEYKHNTKPRIVRFLTLLIVVIVFLLATFSILLICLKKIDGPTVIALVSAFITCLGTILSILMIVVKYIFPEDEDKNFNDLVKSIITNDTARIKDENEYRLKNGRKKDE